LTQAGAPTWGNAADSGNDVLALTLDQAFTSPLTSANDINLYINQIGTTYDGGFFTTGSTDNLSANLTNATFNYYLLDNTNGTTYYNGNAYDPVTGQIVSSTSQVNGANFGSGAVNGWIEQFDIGTDLHGPGVPVTPTTKATNVASGGSYASVTPLTTTGGFGTTVSLLAGTASAATKVTLATINSPSTFGTLASDEVSISGNDGDIFTAQLTFDLNTANKLGGASQMALLWLDPSTQTWINAILGDHGTNDATSAEEDFLGSFAAFQAKYGTNLTLYLGAYGVDTTNNTVWAVIDHNSDFGVGVYVASNSDVPEPSSWMLVLGGLGALLFFHLRRSSNGIGSKMERG
jgi:hypothetical protein